MNIEQGKIAGDVEISNQLQMQGMFTDNVTVKKGGFLLLQGMALKSVVVEVGAIADISGTVSGDVVNNGGKINISGVIKGSILDNSGITEIMDGAIVG